MRPMSEFYPDLPSKVHDRLNDRTFEWKTGWAPAYRRDAKTDKVDGTVFWDGLVLDGWRPAPIH